MTARPPPVRINDLVEPEFPEEIAAAFEMVAPLAAALDWSPEAILAQAARETGLEDFGDDLHVAPLASITSAMVEEEPSARNSLMRSETEVTTSWKVASTERPERSVERTRTERDAPGAGAGVASSSELPAMLNEALSVAPAPSTRV